MIIVVVSMTNENTIEKLFVSGHSDFSKKGSDIVCSAVSILAQSFYLAALSLPGVKVELEDKGDYKVILELDNKTIIGELRGISLFFVKGIIAISKDYGEYINLQIKGENYGSS